MRALGGHQHPRDESENREKKQHPEAYAAEEQGHGECVLLDRSDHVGEQGDDVAEKCRRCQTYRETSRQAVH